MTSRLLAVIALMTGLLGMAGPAVSAAPTTCQVKNLTTGVSYDGSLQSAINAATNGDTIRVRGVCAGNFVIPGAGSGANLTLVGQPGHPGRSTLDGNGAGTVLTIDATTVSVHVTLKDLTVTGGGEGGIFNLGDLILDGRSSVTGNAGGGIFDAGGLIMNDRSSVSGNTNTTFGGLGGGINDEGAVTLNDRSSVTGNTAGAGGGIFDDDNFLALNDHSVVSGNKADFGGGIAELGRVILSGRASVIHNTATGAGGGILAFGVDVCPNWTGAISPNTPDDPPPVTPVTC